MARKTVFITGCSDNGLGAALAIEFHKRSYRVFATARNLSKLEQVRLQGIETIELDVCDASSVAAAVAEVSSLADGKLDILVNNAGIGLSMPITDLVLDDVRELFEANVFSHISVTQAFLPLLMKSDAVGGGLIANQTSAGSMFGMPFQGAYSASKAAAGILTETLRRELAPFGVRVVELKTGIVKTPFFTNVAKAERGAKLPEKSLYGCARDEVEATMGGEGLMSNAPEASVWAKEVVDDLTPSTTPPRIWRGGQALMIWLMTSLPVPSTWLDGVVAEKSGLNKVVESIKAMRRG